MSKHHKIRMATMVIQRQITEMLSEFMTEPFNVSVMLSYASTDTPENHVIISSDMNAIDFHDMVRVVAKAARENLASMEQNSKKITADIIKDLMKA